jgi:two-component system response regulator YesN
MVLNELLSVTLSTICNMGEKIPGELYMDKPIWNILDAAISIEDFEDLTKKIYIIIFDNIDTKSNQRNARIVEQIQEFVKNNCASDITLKDLSKVIYLTPNYLSNIFAKQMGKSFLDYLTECRMNKAKELLATGRYKIYDICEMVGYKNLDYFRKLFKKHIGVNPSFYYQSVAELEGSFSITEGAELK